MHRWVIHKSGEGKKFELTWFETSSIYHTVDGYLMPKSDYVLCDAPAVQEERSFDGKGVMS